ncbi:hypothetical protein ACFWOX_36745 [Streptomyces sp. NPDC058467]|uniref:restriction endonuclease subunit S n=1 Tax=Streptomyces sp. NPDC058467 TaxID=3346513 RepID=UPI0036552C15
MVEYSVTPLRYLLRPVERTGFPSADVLSVYRDHGVIPKESRTDNYNKTPLDLSRYQLVQAGDLVVNKMKAWQGSLGVSAYSGIVSPDYLVCEVSPRVHSRYLHHLLRSHFLIGEFKSRSKGIRPAQWRLYWEDLAKVEVSLPPVKEQRRIADFLDAETSELARIELLSSQLSCLLGERQASLLSNCFSSRTTEAGGALPVNLVLRRVVNRWIDYRGATPEKTVSGVPLVTAKNIRDGKIDMAASREYIAEDAYSDWMRRGLLMHGDVLLTTEAPLGQVAMVDDPGVALAQRVIVLRADQRFCSPEWLYWYLRSPQGQAELELRATGSTALGIKADRLRGVPIPVLKPAEAKERLAQLQSQVSQIESLQGELSRQRALIAERRQALITAAVTGQFDVSTASGRNVTDGVSA